MARKLAIGNKVLVPVKLELTDAGGKKLLFKFNVTAVRRTGAELQAVMTDESQKVGDFLTEIVTGWDGQRLVLEDDGAPSAFSTEAFQDMLDVAGAPRAILSAYLREVMAKEKN